jgi:hypothetical protein
MNIGDWIAAGLNLIQAVAIVAAAVWAYYKFVKGRTFHRRAELELDGSFLAVPSAAVRARAVLRNTGGADIPLRAKILRVATYTTGDVDSRGQPEWREIAKARVFTDHDWIESQETINDDVLIATPEVTPEVVAMRVGCAVYEKRKQRWYKRHQGGGIAWSAASIIPMGPERRSDEGESDE